MKSKYLVLFMAVLAAIALQACGGGGSSVVGAGSTGGVNLSLTDAPGDFNNVFITVSAVRFHKSDVADPRAGDWLRYNLNPPVTLDLLSLANGNMQALWNNIQLPIGTYKQIRLHLVPTFNSNPPTGHTYYNEVVISGPTTTCALIVPDADDGIKLIGTFNVTSSGILKLAIDFNASEDIVEFHEGAGPGDTDYVLKPRLNYFDIDHAGAIIGTLSTGSTFTNSGFVIKAERLATAQEMLDSGSTSTYHVVRRWTVPRANGTFVLSPLSTLVTSTWDVVIRGLNTETMIVKGVPVTNGNTTDLSTISTSTTGSPDYSVAGTIQSPTGAWVQFYQTLPGAGEYPYEIRFRHFNPLWGGFQKTFMLNDDQIQVANFVSSGATLSFTTVNPLPGVGQYDAVAGALMYQRSAIFVTSSATPTVTFTSPLTVQSLYTSNTVSGLISLGTNTTMYNNMNGQMNRGLLFAVHGGMIVNTLNSFNSAIDSQMVSGGSYSINLPGGFPGAFYGIDAVAWHAPLPNNYKAIGIPQIVDLRAGNDTANLVMLPWWIWL